MLKKVVGIIMILNITLFAGYIIAGQGTDIGNNVLRLHVLANSDNPSDQILKLAVKDKIVELMNDEFKYIDDVEDAKTLAEKRIPQIKETAEKTIVANGYDYSVEIEVGKHNFPDRSYGNIVLPQGEYEAVRVIIGSGEGKNWWCVLFPPLCLVSATDKGIALDGTKDAEVSLKCLELLPKDSKLRIGNKQN
ncbi:Stage II sporulation protein required for processing of pro-sigma-E (SpoIIR) [Candidatus Syntrophocurvum alkaliphilum]|uniref:Stage II sporulation protein required for processing of pro-sigma-E (SpoIIR) n=1 Tax=Candidatus Syntrophocurvum alkaliphilum TaxID=2293317 RepID=A0A6I6DEM6_9FIRM|nr:stage II sporulation protein R [Candidatus Syntrophocurvum alkaliphilum]QGU00546.1 Stage II sporulation protein required for processing of pro-sigma-E (SpoIIR) [Candidatus Syntrophocurvum alkaliphilum]